MIAVPLIVVSLIVGLADLKDISKLSKLRENVLFFYVLP
jgi:Na+/H+-dicarboxylate symporter